ncbi:uncharacterized protein L203_100465 [Cryptococcus depauperatus CBS 7841]|uniref:DNA binding protein Ncp1 n=1 Tax=Cryptococcus depauperatus CBS 7841 TaxID=1295531 RepID=A0AAJ8LX90_9TREE
MSYFVISPLYITPFHSFSFVPSLSRWLSNFHNNLAEVQLQLSKTAHHGVRNAVFPSERVISTSQPQALSEQQDQDRPVPQEEVSPVSTGSTSHLSVTKSLKTSAGPPVLLPANIKPQLDPAFTNPRKRDTEETQFLSLEFPQPSVRHQTNLQTLPKPATQPLIEQDHTSYPIETNRDMAVVNSQPLGNDTALANKAAALDLNDPPMSRATQRTDRTAGNMTNGGAGAGVWNALPEQPVYGTPVVIPAHIISEDGDEQYFEDQGGNKTGLISALNSDPNDFKQKPYEEKLERPIISEHPSRSYIHPSVPIVTTYEPELPIANKSKSVAESTRAPVVKTTSRTASIDGGSPGKTRSVKRASSKTGSLHSSDGHFFIDNHANGHESRRLRPLSQTASARKKELEDDAAVEASTFAVGEFASPERQRELQSNRGSRRHSRVSLHDDGPVPHAATYEDAQHYANQPNPSIGRTMSPRPHSAFGHRPQPQLRAINEVNGEPQDGMDSRAGVLGRSGTVLSRANTLGRNGTLSRGANGGTIGSRRGAFGRGAGASIGTQPEEVLGRDDIHARAELSERILGDATLRRLSNMEKKDARRLTKVIKKEARAEAKAVQGSIKELERIAKLQKEAARAEPRLRFLKEKEIYERVEGELRNAENDYEERRDHAAGLTAQVAEKTQDLDDLRAQKAADDREREVKILALKSPAHS